MTDSLRQKRDQASAKYQTDKPYFCGISIERHGAFCAGWDAALTALAELGMGEFDREKFKAWLQEEWDKSSAGEYPNRFRIAEWAHQQATAQIAALKAEVERRFYDNITVIDQVNANNATLRAQAEKLAEALEWYRAIGDDNDYRMEECLERAMDDRAADKVTINLGGKYVAEVARAALAEYRKDKL